jgi:pilus assembly protein CpaE
MMTGPIKTLIAVDGNIDAGRVEMLVDDPGIRVVGVTDRDAEPSETAADVLLVACASESQDTLDYIARVTKERPDRPVIVAAAGSPNGFVREVFAAGADDIVLLDDSATPGADAFFAMQKALARRSGGHTPDEARGSTICVLGPKGGIGKTLTAANLGAALAEAGHRVAMVDLDLQFGDLGLALGLQPERTIYDLATSGGTLDAEKVDAYLAEHSSGARVLLAPLRPDQAGSVTVEFLRTLYPVLASTYEYVVVDTPPGFTPEVITTIDASSSICMIGMLDAPSLKNTKLGMETLELMAYPIERVRIVLNRADTNVGISHADVVAVMGRPPDVLIPSQREIVRSINLGEPIVLSAKRSEPAKAFRALADLYVQSRAGAPAHNGGRRRLLRRA